MQQIRAISMDLDDTLWAIGPVIARAEHALWTWLGTHYPRITERWDADALQALAGRIRDAHSDRLHDLRFLRKAVLAHMARDGGYDEGLVDAAFDVFDRERNRVEFFPDVLPALRQLAAGYRLIAVTNGNACLQTIGIRGLFAEVLCAADAGAAKPERTIFDAAVRAAGTTAAEVLHVGDHPEIDVAGAQAAGLRAAWMNRAGDDWPQGARPPDAIVSGMDELCGLLASAPRRGAFGAS